MKNGRVASHLSIQFILLSLVNKGSSNKVPHVILQLSTNIRDDLSWSFFYTFNFAKQSCAHAVLFACICVCAMHFSVLEENIHLLH